ANGKTCAEIQKAYRERKKSKEGVKYDITKRVNTYLNGVKQVVGPGRVYGAVGADCQYALSWLQKTAAKYADKMPDSTKLHLPCCLTKKAVYEMMVTEAEVFGHNPRSRFTTCDICSKIKREIERTTCRTTRKKLFKIRGIHLEQQNDERKKSYKHAQKARSNPDQYVSIILDGMDQEKNKCASHH
ncbi:hypothetical protein MAR_021436, partial [Mya arenaria]